MGSQMQAVGGGQAGAVAGNVELDGKIKKAGKSPPSLFGYTDLMVDGAPLPHQPDTIIRWLIDRPRS